jgi:hypothetical protein
MTARCSLPSVSPPFTNILVLYHGGGYDGCIWEWNAFYLDECGEFHNIYASGHDGIKDKEDADALLNSEASDVLVVKLDAAENVWRLVDSSINPSFLYAIYSKLPWDATAGLFCDDCGCFVHASNFEDLHLENPSCHGGISYFYDNKYCSSCWYNHMCRVCEAVDGAGSEAFCTDLDDNGLCWSHAHWAVLPVLDRIRPELLEDYGWFADLACELKDSDGIYRASRRLRTHETALKRIYETWQELGDEALLPLPPREPSGQMQFNGRMRCECNGLMGIVDGVWKCEECGRGIPAPASALQYFQMASGTTARGLPVKEETAS